MEHNQNLPTIIYGAGKEAKNAYEKLLECGIKAVCFVDADTAKWNKPAFKDSSVIVISFERAIDEYKDFNIYISIKSAIKYNVIKYLTEEKQVKPDKIINYEPVSVRKSCTLLETTMTPLGTRDIGLCRGGRLINVTKMPTVEWTDNASGTVDKFLELRESLISEIQDSLDTSPCKDCIALREQPWPDEYKIINYVLSTEPNSICQFKCIYCYSGHYGNNELVSKHSNDSNIDKRVELLQELEKRGIADPLFTTVSLSDGELCVDPKRENLFAVVEKYKSVIYTNAGVFSEKIASLLERNKTYIVVSVDAGTKETFKSVKGADAFNKVCDNLQKYSAINNKRTWLQYIFLPDINDSNMDIDGFVSLCDRVKPGKVHILTNVLSNEGELNRQTIERLFSLFDKLLLNDMNIFVGGNVSLSETEKNIIREMANDAALKKERPPVYYERLEHALAEICY
jgi:wyosine [tRNA(Phe)-imidazoG37] synthetase (radical SAM superfamily)